MNHHLADCLFGHAAIPNPDHRPQADVQIINVLAVIPWMSSFVEP